MKEIDFKDFDALRSEISEEYSAWSESYLVSQGVIDDFASLSGDRQWIHTDVERARNSPYGTTIAHGFLLLALMPRVRPPQDFTVVNHSSVANYGSKGLRFLAPVPSGAAIWSRLKLIEVEEHPKGTLLTSEVVMHAEGNDKPALIYNMSLLYL